MGARPSALSYDQPSGIGRRVGELPEDGLAADDDEVALVRDRRRSAKNVLEIDALHRLRLATVFLTVSRKMRCLVLGSSANENGLACRSAVAVSDSSTSARRSSSRGPSRSFSQAAR